MFCLADARSGQRVMDPSCGDGSFLKSAPEGLIVHACEVDPQYARIAADLVDAGRFFGGDALSRVEDLEDRFDLVIGNPPFSAQLNLETRGRFLDRYELGVGRKSQCLEVLFIELFWRLTTTGGRIAVILPDGPLANGPLQYVRDWLLKRCRIEAIISLPRDTFLRTSAKTHIVLATKLPVSAKPYRHPTWLLTCDTLDQLRVSDLASWTATDPAWRQAVLADQNDWRPEAGFPTVGQSAGDVVRLGDWFHIRTGAAKYGEARELFDVPDDDSVLLIRAKNLSSNGGLLLDQNLAYIKRSGPMFRDKALVRAGQILFVRVGAGCYGRTAVVPPDLVAQADDWIHMLTPNTGFDTARVADWFISEAGRAAVGGLAKGVGTVSISKSALANLMVPAELFR